MTTEKATTVLLLFKDLMLQPEDVGVAVWEVCTTPE
jgi:hypothetical protein